jgi:hypothetical protein
MEFVKKMNRNGKVVVPAKIWKAQDLQRWWMLYLRIGGELVSRPRIWEHEYTNGPIRVFVFPNSWTAFFIRPFR